MGILKLGKMTLEGLFKKPETLQYPFETKTPYEGQKGTIKHIDPNICNCCGICAKRCPCNAITVNKKEAFWKINHFQCIQCGYCTQSCPKKCIVMDGALPSVSPEKHDEVVSINL